MGKGLELNGIGKTLKGFPVDDNIVNWVIGQDQVLKSASYAFTSGFTNLSALKMQSDVITGVNPISLNLQQKQLISPGSYLLLLGGPGTGKSLIGRALAEKLTQIYSENNIQLYDVICWKNSASPSQLRISIHRAGEGKKILQREQVKELKRKFA